MEAKYRSRLPQLDNLRFMTDGGLETTLMFHRGIELPEFAAFTLLDTAPGTQILKDYFAGYAKLAQRFRLGLMLDSATWRANPDWGSTLGYSADQLAGVNRKAISMLREIRDVFETDTSKMVISGSIGPRGDGYVPAAMMSADEAAEYHADQIRTFSQTEADMVTAFTINYVEEAVGIAHAGKQAQMPTAISFTVETDGALPSGQSLQEAIERTDADSDGYPVYYMINCAHPQHFTHMLKSADGWLERIYGVRANASMKSHAELNESTELDDGDPVMLARQYKEISQHLPKLRIVGGCCGTDERHLEEIGKMFSLA